MAIVELANEAVALGAPDKLQLLLVLAINGLKLYLIVNIFSLLELSVIRR